MRSGLSTTMSACTQQGRKRRRKRKRRSLCCCHRARTMRRCSSPRRRGVQRQTAPRPVRRCNSHGPAWTSRSSGRWSCGRCCGRSVTSGSCRSLVLLGAARGLWHASSPTMSGSGTCSPKASTTSTWTTCAGSSLWIGPSGASSSSRAPRRATRRPPPVAARPPRPRHGRCTTSPFSISASPCPGTACSFWTGAMACTRSAARHSSIGSPRS
mmetsp:Transcript_103124/g.298323  ORF Transcript_103124/g.298323 Transcript_103124/m.298323 type:complete len:212 (-) Transcript_103124:2301-2936(-)